MSDIKSETFRNDSQIKLNFFTANNNSFHLYINFEAITFQNNEINITNDGDEIYIDEYKPNSVWSFVIKKKPNDNNEDDNINTEYKIGARVVIDYLDLDFDKNDYVMIGAGERPDFWFNTKFHLITSKITSDNEKMTFWINADSAFVL